jgi:hypothetical protein
LKVEEGQAKIKAKNQKGFTSNHSSEKERQTLKKDNKGSKKAGIKIDREEILEYPQELLPAEAQFKGYEEESSKTSSWQPITYYSGKRNTTLLTMRRKNLFGRTSLGL